MGSAGVWENSRDTFFGANNCKRITSSVKIPQIPTFSRGLDREVVFLQAFGYCLEACGGSIISRGDNKDGYPKNQETLIPS